MNAGAYGLSDVLTVNTALDGMMANNNAREILVTCAQYQHVLRCSCVVDG